MESGRILETIDCNGGFVRLCLLALWAYLTLLEVKVTNIPGELKCGSRILLKTKSFNLGSWRKSFKMKVSQYNKLYVSS